MKSGDTVLNSVKGTRERIGRLVQMTAADRTEIEEVRAGDIAAAIGLKTLLPVKPCVMKKHLLSWNAWSSQSQLSMWLLNLKPKLTKKKWVLL